MTTPKNIKQILTEQLTRVLKHRHMMKWDRQRENRLSVQKQARRLVAEIRGRS